MKQSILFAIITMSLLTKVSGQKYFTKSGEVSFFSRTNMENIDAITNTANCVLDLATGNVEMAVLIKSFTFEKALMQEHFNENYVESDKYPNATFNGKIINLKAADLDKGKQTVEVDGDLTIHGVTKKIKTTATLEKKGDKIIGYAVFPIKPTDHGIKIPSAVVKNIAESIETTVNISLDPAK